MDAVLVGDEPKIRDLCAKLNINADDFKIIHEPENVAASLAAVKLVHDGEGVSRHVLEGERHVKLP